MRKKARLAPVRKVSWKGKQYGRRLVVGGRTFLRLNIPPDIKVGLQAIADHEKHTVSWVMEQVIIDYFSLKAPKYRLSH